MSRRSGLSDRASRRRLGLAAGLVVALVALPPAVVMIGTARHRHSAVAEVAPAPVAIVLGAGVIDGEPSPFLAERIRVGVELYRAGTVRALLMSGDHSRTDHDEVDVMARHARRLGVPDSAIVLDHAGFDTYSSCYRARSVWGIDRAVVVTQAFHLPRAVWLCRRLGVATEGAVAGDLGYTSVSGYGWARELPAIDKAVLDVVRGRTPIFPGPREHTLDAVISPPPTTGSAPPAG